MHHILTVFKECDTYAPHSDSLQLRIFVFPSKIKSILSVVEWCDDVILVCVCVCACVCVCMCVCVMRAFCATAFFQML